MAVIASNVLTLADWANRVDPDGRIPSIVEILAETNTILEDMLWMEGNMETGHKSVIRTGLPEPTWRMLNYGVQPSKSRTAPVVDTCGNLEDYSKVDKDIADMGGNTNEFRASEDAAHIEGMNQTVAETLFYGNQAVNKEKFTGLAPRYNDLSAESGDNIIDAEGTGSDNTSIWLVTWSDRTCFGIFPKGKKGGLQMNDQGEDRVTDENGGFYQAYITHFKWECGLVVKDWRYVVRIANIDVSDLAAAGTSGYSGPDLELLMIEAVHKLPSEAVGKPVFYCNREVSTALHKIVAKKQNMYLSLDEFGGKKILSFLAFPVRRVDAILNTEAQVE